MKKKIIRNASMAVAAFAGLSMSAFASGNISVTNMALESSAKVQIGVEVPTHENVSLSLRDDQGKTIYFDMIEKNSDYEKVFDFNQLDDGHYTFITEANNANFIKTVEFKEKNISVIKKEMITKPVFTVDGDLLKVYYVNQLIEDISISLEDYNMIYFEEEGNDDFTYNKEFDLTRLPSGVYTINLEVGFTEYNYSFRR